MLIPVDLRYPFTGRWLVQNSPADRVPSHGTAVLAASYAIDFVPVGANGRSAPMRFQSWLRPEPPERFPGFGRAVTAPVSGVVLAAQGAHPDHRAYRGLPSLGYALTQQRLALAGWEMLAGNHVLIEHEDSVIALCHLQQHSLSVRSGEKVRAGDVIGRCGDSGNSTEPHLHVQAINSPWPERATAVPLTFDGSLPRNGTIVTGKQGG